MVRRFNDVYASRLATDATGDFFDVRFEDIDLRLHQLEEADTDVQNQIDDVVDSARERVDLVIAPALSEIEELQNQIDPASFATSAQGALADTAIQPADLIAAIDALLDSAPGALDTLNELAAALGDDANFATTMTAALATKLDASAIATAAQYRSAASGTNVLTTENVWAAAAEVDLGGGSDVVPDWSSFINGSITLTADRELSNGSGYVVGKTGRLRVVTNGHNLTFASDYVFAGGAAPTLSGECMLPYEILATNRILIYPPITDIA